MAAVGAGIGVATDAVRGAMGSDRYVDFEGRIGSRQRKGSDIDPECIE